MQYLKPGNIMIDSWKKNKRADETAATESKSPFAGTKIILINAMYLSTAFLVSTIKFTPHPQPLSWNQERGRGKVRKKLFWCKNE